MPLSRYEIRSEYSLANPDLYRAADKDDPEGLLEGVAMAGLVGIIRQLGDLAEFAAEVFHDLHEDVLAMAARGHELLVRVRQLETEVPLIEKMTFTKIDHGKCMYNPGLEWHVHIYNDQNHFTQGDLPRFIRSAYEDCRSPPRLFPLDRFDVAGAGSCLKRFTDPSFFKMEWASSELMKAEKEQRDQKARRMKRKGRRQAYGEAREAKIASHVQLREPTQVEKIETPSSASDWSVGSEQGDDDSPTQEDMLLAAGLPISEREGPQSTMLAAQDLRVKECPPDLKMEWSTPVTARHMDVGVLKDPRIDVGKEEVIADDSASETDNFMDAVTTMDSEAETDSEMKARNEVDGELLAELEEVEAPAPPSQPPFVLGRGADEELDVKKEDKELSVIEEIKQGLIIERDSGDHTPEEALNTEHAHFVASSPKGFTKEEGSSSADGSVVTTSVQDNETSTLNSGSGILFPGLGEDTMAKSEGHLIDNTLTVFAEEEDISVVVQTAVVLAVKDNGSISISQSNVSSPDLEEGAAEGHLQSESNASSPGLEEDAVLNSERKLRSGSNSLVLQTPEALVLDKDSPESNRLPESDVPSKDLPQNNSLKDFHQLPESDAGGKDLPQSNTPKDHGEITTRKRWQISKLFTKEFLASDLERDSLQVSENEQSESPRKPSLQSSPSSSIQPMKWTMDLSRTYHTDDEMEDMQASSASHSSSSSTLSSPRPSTLATTLLNLSLERKPQKSVESSPQSLISSSSKSGTKTAPASQVETTVEPLVCPDFENSANSSPHSSSSAEQPFFDPLPSSALNVNTSTTGSLAQSFSAQNLAANNLEINPPPPPLPPLAWRMTRRAHSAVVNSPTSIPIPSDVGVSSNDLWQASTSSTILLTVPHSSSVEPNELTQAFSSPSPSIGKLTFQKSEAILEESSTYETGLSDLETLRGRSADLPQVSEPAKSHDTWLPCFTPNSGIVEQGTISVLATDCEGENVVTERPDASLQEKVSDDNTRITSSCVLQTERIPARLDESRLELETKAAVEYGSSALQRSNLPYVLAPDLERKDFSEATTSHDMSRIKKRSKWAWTSSTASSDDREVLLDQIRTRSFSLRNTSREKLAAPRPVTNINVAAILEKANAIRQAFAGSDEDDDEEWSDA